MPVFNYTGINDKGKNTTGIVDAENERAARAKLRKMGVYPTKIGLSGKGGGKLSLSTNIDLSKYFQRIKTQDIAVMTRQLSTLVGSGIPLVESLQALEDQVDNVKLKTIVTSVRERVTEGSKLSDAMRTYPKVFDVLYVNMVDAGENSGALEVVLERLADFTENQAKLKSKVIGAMIYPILMSVVGAALMLMLIVYVVPKVTKIFEDVNATLPLPTRVLISVSDAVIGYWYIIILFLILVAYGIKRWLKTEKGREIYDKKILHVPLFGNLFRMVAISRFTRTLSTLLNSGVPLLTSMDIVKNIMTNVVLKRVVDETRDSVKEGESIAGPLKRSGEFPPIVTHMVAIGEKTGQMEKMLERVADSYDMQIDTAVSTLMTLLEPLMILVMAAIVSFIVMSILLPILQLNQLGA
jgi:general secretion pathway protein F